MTRPPASARLTPREREIANLLGQGLTNKEIAWRLKISQRTADTHVQNMLNKLDASNRAQIVALASDAQPERQPTPASVPTTPAQVAGRAASGAFGRTAVMAAGALIVVLLLSADRQAGLVVSPAVSAAPTTTTSETQMSDPFGEADIDASMWNVATGPHLRVFKANGHLAVYVGADAGQEFQAGVISVCRMRGDFDAQVSFELVTWPRLNALWVSLMASGTPFNTYRTSRDYTDYYGTYLPPAGGEVDASGTTGTLRLRRVGSTWSGYYMSSGGWTRIASGDGPVEDVGLNVWVFNGGVPFGGREALVYFRNLRVTATKVVCP